MKVQSGVLQLQSAVQGHRAWARQGVAGSVAFSLALLVAAPARADRAEIYRPPELVAMADVVVLGRVVSVQAAPSSKDVAAARITVDKISKGKLSAAQIEVRYHSPGISATPPQLISRYSLQLRQGNRYFFFLMAPVAGETFYRLVEDRDGAQPYSPGMGAEVAREVRDGQGRFRLNARAVRALLLAEAYTVPVNGHVTLKVLLQPVAKAGARYSLVRWPEARMSWAELLVRRDGKPVAHSRIPWLSKSESESYFKARLLGPAVFGSSLLVFDVSAQT